MQRNETMKEKVEMRQGISRQCFIGDTKRKLEMEENQ